jgi:aminoglycoside phosphotransferase (APT) family kinase protein
MRLSRGTDAWLTSDRSVERELHGLAAAAGFAPRIVHADTLDRWLITEYAIGRLWTAADFTNPEQLMRLADTLRRLHALPSPARGRFDLLGALGSYVQRITAHGSGSGSIAHYLAEAAEAWRICGADERPQAILHHDLNAANIIENESGLLLIDWECAAVSDPLLDVACRLSYYAPAWSHVALLLQYSGLENITHRQLAAAVWLFDLHSFLWYRERRLRLFPTDAELEAERQLGARLPGGLIRWSKAACGALDAGSRKA